MEKSCKPGTEPVTLERPLILPRAASRRLAAAFAALALALMACATLSGPIDTVEGLLIPSPTWTATPTLPLPTSTSSPTPRPTWTATESPSSTPEPLQSPTSTLVAPPPFPVATLPNTYDCRLVWQSPHNNVTYNSRDIFTVGWKIMNTGSSAWDPGSVTFTYLGGAKLGADPVVPLTSSVAPGSSIVLSVRMKAPRNSTTYTTYWGLRQSNTYFCVLMFSFYVK